MILLYQNILEIYEKNKTELLDVIFKWVYLKHFILI